jgi:hypothetical protein
MDLIKLGPKEQLDQDFGEDGAILIPNAKSKAFLHWLTDKGNIRSTFTMTYATKVVSKVRIINALDEELVIQVLTKW